MTNDYLKIIHQKGCIITQKHKKTLKTEQKATF